MEATSRDRTATGFVGALRRVWPRHRQGVVVWLAGSLTLGLAPFYPHAHIWKQLVNIAHGTLTEPIDVFDLVMHGVPWVALAVVATRLVLDAVRTRDGVGPTSGAERS